MSSNGKQVSKYNEFESVNASKPIFTYRYFLDLLFTLLLWRFLGADLWWYLRYYRRLRSGNRSLCCLFWYRPLNNIITTESMFVSVLNLKMYRTSITNLLTIGEPKKSTLLCSTCRIKEKHYGMRYF